MSNDNVVYGGWGDRSGRGDHNDGNTPQGPTDMEARVTALETRLDTVLPTLATKADLAEVRTEIHQSTSQMIKWVAGTGIAVASILVSAFIALSNKIDRPHAAQPQQAAPIVIQVPAYQPPPPAMPPPPASK